MNFRLTYDGPLKAASQSDTRRAEKHAIRSVFNRQLNELFTVRGASFLDKELEAMPQGSNIALTRRGEFNCFALVREKLHLVCDLDILFLRREDPGHVVSGGGDLDNRIKVLFDALRMPQDDNEVRGFALPVDGDRLLLCLTEDDSLITGLRVTTDRLLEPANSPAEVNNVRLIINVEVKATQLTEENMAYFSHF